MRNDVSLLPIVTTVAIVAIVAMESDVGTVAELS